MDSGADRPHARRGARRARPAGRAPRSGRGPTRSPSPRTGLYRVVILATLLLGIAEVLHDNCAQTFMPSIVHRQLEKANGRMWSAESVANTFVGPPLGVAAPRRRVRLPFFVDAGSFAVAAALVLSSRARPGPTITTTRERKPWRSRARRGLPLAVAAQLLRPMAIILGMLNLRSMVTRRRSSCSPRRCSTSARCCSALIGMGGAVGGIVGGARGRLSPSGRQRSVPVADARRTPATIVVGLSSHWPAVFVMFALTSLLAVLWNVITVSLRQTIIPSTCSAG